MVLALAVLSNVFGIKLDLPRVGRDMTRDTRTSLLKTSNVNVTLTENKAKSRDNERKKLTKKIVALV